MKIELKSFHLLFFMSVNVRVYIFTRVWVRGEGDRMDGWVVGGWVDGWMDR